MSRTCHRLLSASVVVALLVAAGCGAGPEATAAPDTITADAAASTPDTSSTPDTAEVAAATEEAATEKAAENPEKKKAHGHDHTAPHGGVLVELGDHFAYLEFVLEPETGTLTMYVLDGEAEKALRVTHETVGVLFTTPEAIAARPFELRAKANVLTGETVGDTSQFTLTQDAFVGLTAFTAKVIEVRVKGRSFRDVAITWPEDHE
jgi:hypothetical protein